MIKKELIIIILAIFSLCGTLSADEGMWLVNNIDEQLYKQMKERGVKIARKDIYNENGPSVKDAVVALDGGMCSGSIVSAKGLMITNHHCAYSDVHGISTPEKNYLEDGFWAFKTEDEIPIKGKTVSFLKKVIDVTDEVKSIIDSLEQLGPRTFRFMGKVEKILLEKIGKLPYSEMQLASMWRENKFYLYLYDVYGDVRLVGVPPVSVGAFGGEQDNWGWPQQKGDFALYRVYMSPDGKPAKYNKENIPLDSKENHLTVSTKGVQNGDYTMILGYPGQTNRYIPSAELKEIYEILNPVSSTIRRMKLDVWDKYMAKDSLVRLKYQNAYFGISNYCDYAKWGNICIKKYHIIDFRRAEEEKLQEWIKASPERIEKYGTLIDDLKKGYDLRAEVVKNKEILRETMIRGADILIFASRMGGLCRSIKHKKRHLERGCKEFKNFRKMNFNELFNEKDMEVEKQVCIAMLEYCAENMDKRYMGDEFKALLEANNGDCKKIVEDAFATSVLTDSVRFRRFFDGNVTKEMIEQDPIVRLRDCIDIVDLNRMDANILETAGINLVVLKRKYVDALYHFRADMGLAQYPDANSTMRFTYGNVSSIEPADGVYYHWQSTSDGIKEKFDKSDYEFNMTPEVYALIEKGDFGRWGVNGKLPVDFLSNNDITGGNSGSAVLNAKGELIGLAFDGNREAMSCDYYFHERYCKCVNVDIRYVLWIIDKYAGAQNILDEMGI